MDNAPLDVAKLCGRNHLRVVSVKRGDPAVTPSSVRQQPAATSDAASHAGDDTVPLPDRLHARFKETCDRHTAAPSDTAGRWNHTPQRLMFGDGYMISAGPEPLGQFADRRLVSVVRHARLMTAHRGPNRVTAPGIEILRIP